MSLSEEFVKGCVTLWGVDDWKPTAADTFGVTVRNVQHWAAGTKEPPLGVMRELLNLLDTTKKEVTREIAALDAAHGSLLKALTEAVAVPLDPVDRA